MHLSKKISYTILLTLIILNGCRTEASSKETTKDVKAMNDGMYAKIITNRGEIIVSLEYEKTPLTVINFAGLAEGNIKTSAKKGPFYDGLKFHRVIDNFMVQGGDPQGNGTGGPGYKFADEIDNSLKFSGPGVLAMANSGPATNGSQFFITHVATPHLQGKHTIFGNVIEGMDVVNAIEQGDEIKSVQIIRVGEKAEAFKTNQEAFDAAQGGMKDKAKTASAEKNKAVFEDIAKRWPKAETSNSGIFYVITEAGNGTKPTKGAMVDVHYEGRLMDDTKFDSSYDRNEPISFNVGTGRVIPGWDEMIMDMELGEKRTIVIPPELAYGSSGAGGVIPPDAWLIFDCELVDIK